MLAALFSALIAFVFNPMEERVCVLECYCVGTKFIAVKSPFQHNTVVCVEQMCITGR
jgi:hypothetical protein